MCAVIMLHNLYLDIILCYAICTYDIIYIILFMLFAQYKLCNCHTVYYIIYHSTYILLTM